MIPVDFGDWPGRIVFGVGAVGRLSELVGEVGGSRALVICGSTVARGEMLAKVKSGLGARLAGVFAEAKSHTPIEMVERGLAAFRDSGADVLVDGRRRLDHRCRQGDRRHAGDRRRSRALCDPLCAGRRDAARTASPPRGAAHRGADHRGLGLRRHADGGVPRSAVAAQAPVLGRRARSGHDGARPGHGGAHAAGADCRDRHDRNGAGDRVALLGASPSDLHRAGTARGAAVARCAAALGGGAGGSRGTRSMPDGLHHVGHGGDQRHGVGRARDRPHRRRSLRASARHLARHAARARHAPAAAR